jgi:hypothetical protein
LHDYYGDIIFYLVSIKEYQLFFNVKSKHVPF